MFKGYYKYIIIYHITYHITLNMKILKKFDEVILNNCYVLPISIFLLVITVLSIVAGFAFDIPYIYSIGFTLFGMEFFFMAFLLFRSINSIPIGSYDSNDSDDTDDLTRSPASNSNV